MMAVSGVRARGVVGVLGQTQGYLAEARFALGFNIEALQASGIRAHGPNMRLFLNAEGVIRFLDV